LNLSNAEGYFREHLATGDYYMDGHVVRGEWRGVAASMLGLDRTGDTLHIFSCVVWIIGGKAGWFASAARMASRCAPWP
jgi:hypothetical protein